MKHVMLDLETLGTSADSVIVSIGAVKFDIKEIDDAGFYTPVSIDSNLHAGRKISGDTLAWWMGQSEAARKVFSAPNVALEEALKDLAVWFDRGQYKVWSNGASFDIPMLEHAYKYFGLSVPWQFWDAMCFRTMKNLPIARKLPKLAPTIAHNALSDAVAQAQMLQQIWKLDEKALAC